MHSQCQNSVLQRKENTDTEIGSMAVSVIEKEIEIVTTIEIERKAIRVVTRATNTVSMTNTIDATALAPAVVIATTRGTKSTRNTRGGKKSTTLRLTPPGTKLAKSHNFM